jgi:phosphohistidine phosphatase
MQLLIIRHAIAEDRAVFAATGQDDDLRPLTSFGRRRMRRNAEGLRRTAPHIECLASSPLVRAQQTARIVADEYRIRDLETLDALRPGRHPRELLQWLGKQPADATIAVVGHAPQVGALVSWCVAGVPTGPVAFKKGGVALVEFAGKPAAGKGQLHWHLTPAHLRVMAE